MLPRQANDLEVGPGSGRKSGAVVELERVQPIDGIGQRAAPARIALQVVADHAVHRRAAAGVVGAVQRRPQPGVEVVDRMPLHRVQRILPAHAVAGELIVVSVEGDPRGGLECPGAERLGHAQFRLERPAVGADVDQSVGVVLPGGCRHEQRHADDRVLLVLAKILQRQRRRAVQVDRQAHAAIGEPSAACTAGLFEDLAAGRQPGIGHDHRQASRLAPDIDDAAVGQVAGIDAGLDIAHRQRRVGQHIAPLVAVAGNQEVQPDGCVAVRQRLHGLSRGARHATQGQRREGDDERRR